MNTATNTTDDLTTYSDSDLVAMFRKSGDQQAFETLVRRHYSSIQRRFAAKLNNPSDADDMTQQLWIRVVENIDTYDESGRFPHYISTIATNLLNDHWRKKGYRDQFNADWPEEDGVLDQKTFAQGNYEDADSKRESSEVINKLVTEFIPKLPVEQRTIYLLRHESEHWDEKQRLGWEHLAQLNGMDITTVWSKFEDARRHLLKSDQDSLKDSEAACVFFTWTQAQRPGKHYTFEDKDFSEMLDIPVNTLKSRYRAAIKQLTKDLSAYNTQQ